MKFGLFYELSVPRPWTRESERTVYMNALDQVRLADELGFDQVWAVEHHFLEEYSHCPAPELFLTACAMITKKMRVGHGIVICVPEFNHPIKIAERTAVLDILSGGRLEVDALPPGRRWAASARIPTRRRRRGTSSCAAFPRCGRRRRTRMTACSGRCQSAPSCPRYIIGRIRPCGSP